MIFFNLQLVIKPINLLYDSNKNIEKCNPAFMEVSGKNQKCIREYYNWL